MVVGAAAAVECVKSFSFKKLVVIPCGVQCMAPQHQFRQQVHSECPVRFVYLPLRTELRENKYFQFDAIGSVQSTDWLGA